MALGRWKWNASYPIYENRFSHLLSAHKETCSLWKTLACFVWTQSGKKETYGMMMKWFFKSVRTVCTGAEVVWQRRRLNGRLLLYSVAPGTTKAETLSRFKSTAVCVCVSDKRFLDQQAVQVANPNWLLPTKEKQTTSLFFPLDTVACLLQKIKESPNKRHTHYTCAHILTTLFLYKFKN